MKDRPEDTYWRPTPEIMDRSTWVDCIHYPGWQHPTGTDPECDAAWERRSDPFAAKRERVESDA